MTIQSSMLRKIVFAFFFLGLIPFSALFHYPIIEWKWKIILNLSGAVIIIFAAVFAIYVHSLFPRTHKRPEDFEQLLVDGPYRYVRHPFYSAFIVMGFGIALYFLSIPGIIFNVFLILMWRKLADIEEKGLLEHYGEKYKQFMETRPRFFPRIHKRYKKHEQNN